MIILSDLSEVLIGGLSNAVQWISEHYGADAARLCLARIQQTKPQFDDLKRGKISEAEYKKLFFTGAGLPFQEKDINEAFSESFQIVVPDTLKVYQRIVAYPRFMSHHTELVQGMPNIYIVSDHIAERIDEIKKYHPGLFRVTTGQFWSCKLGKLKGDTAYFSGLLRRLGVGTNEVLFIDNNPDNIAAAAAASLANITFSSASQLEEDLKRYGFVIAPSSP